MNLIDVLTDKEIQMMNEYRRNFATPYGDDRCCDDTSITGHYIDSREILKPWAKAKEPLYHMFGDKLIVEKEVQFDVATEVIEANLRKMIKDRQNIFNIRNEETIQKAYHFYVKFCEAFHDESLTWREYNSIENLISFYTLARNKYSYNDCVIFDIKFQCGTKPMKLIEKVARHYGILDEGFEEFRLIHSLGLNNKKSKGVLCLSIHPLDYMTMSDNESGWASCMSWRNDGCYRQGTVEMMNSPTVVVGYLKTVEPVHYCGTTEWNNKKWRQLFIVDEDIITGVKQYPTAHDDLRDACLDMLRDFAGAEKYSDEKVILPEHEEFHRFNYKENGVEKSKRIYFGFETDYMYNDFGSVSDLPIYLGLNVEDDDRTWVNYSGQCQCMCCGSTTNGLHSDTLLCDYCYEEEEPTYCQHCGDRLYNEDDMYYLDGEYYCYHCFCERRRYVINDCEEHDKSSCVKFKVYDPESGYVYNLADGENEKAYYHVHSGNLVDTINKLGTVYHKSYYDQPGNTYSCWWYTGTIIYLDINAESTADFLADYGLTIDKDSEAVPTGTLHTLSASTVRR